MMLAEMAGKTYIENSLSKRIIFFTGKGGVGKSTVTWATALLAKRRGARVAVTSWSPLDNGAKPEFLDHFGIDWLPLETLSCFREYALQILKFERVYSAVFDNHVLRTFVKAAPGLSETVIAGKLWDLYAKKTFDLILVDLPSTGHALSFFNSPMGIQKIFATGFVHKEAKLIVDMFGASDARVDIVALPEEMPIVEGLELKAKLKTLLPFHFGFLHMNQLLEDFPIPNMNEASMLPDVFKEALVSYQVRQTQQNTMMERTQAFEMPIVRVPRFTSEHLVENIENVARALST